MTHAAGTSDGTVQARHAADSDVTWIRLTADQSRATAGLLCYALDADEGRYHDQEWLIANPVTEVLELDSNPDDAQYDAGVAIIATLADKLATPSRALVPFMVDEHLLLAALLDYAFYKDDVHDRQQWPIEAAAYTLYPNLEDAPSPAQYGRALRLLYEARARLDPLPERPDIRAGDCLHAWDLEELEENECGYQIVAVDNETVTVRDADGADHQVMRAAIEARDAGVVRYFGDFETQPDDPGYREQREREQQESLRRQARFEQERRARTFAEPYERPYAELSHIDALVADRARLINGFRGGAIPTGDVERSIRKQQAKIATLESARAETMAQIAAQAAELRESTDPRHAAVLAWQTARDATRDFARERNAALADINARFDAGRAAGDPDAHAVRHHEWQATMNRYQELIDAASAGAEAAFDDLVALCEELTPRDAVASTA